jgi:hypothetical protein
VSALRLAPETLDSILSAGVLAPSADNHHLFRFRVLEDLILVIGSEAYGAASSQTKLLAWISFGAVVENMCIQASHLGYDADVTWITSEEVVCEIRLAPSSVRADPLASAISSRRTNRRLFYSKRRLQASEQTELERQAASAEGVRLTWLDAKDDRRRALRLMRLAESERFRSHALHSELFSGLRFDVGSKESCAEGIPIGAAEIEPFARPMFRALRHWPTMQLLNRLLAYRLIGWRAAYLPGRLAPHIGLITAAQRDLRPAAIHAGRGFERLWLSANRMGFELQPLVAGPLYALPQFEGVSAKVRETLNQGWRRWAGEDTPLIVFRLGQAAAPTVRAGRPPLHAFLQQQPLT